MADLFIRNVPPEVRDWLFKRATAQDISVAECVRLILAAEKAKWDNIVAQTKQPGDK